MAADPQAVAAFISDPIGFMKSNLVRAPTCKTREYGRPVELTLEPDPSATATCGDAGCKVYGLRAIKEKEIGFKSYICDFSSDAICYQVLAAEADFMFTFAMTGCTFGVGSPTPGGEVLVSHSNAKSGKDMTQTQRQFAYTEGLHGEHLAKALEPDAYRPDGQEIATTFGVRTSRKWKFFYLSYQVVKASFPIGYKHFGVYSFSGQPA
ncbi:MAG: hypothetical protein V4488_00965 [Pseudomonadota bacterium]